MTLVGPMATDASFVNDASYINGGNYYPNNGSSLGKFQAAMHIRRDTHLNCFNSVAIGWPIGIIIDNEKGDTQGAATAGNLKLENIWLANVNAVGTDFNKIYVDGLYNYETNRLTNLSLHSQAHSSRLRAATSSMRLLQAGSTQQDISRHQAARCSALQHSQTRC